MTDKLKPFPTNSPGYQERYAEISEAVVGWMNYQGIGLSPATFASLCHRLVNESLRRTPDARLEAERAVIEAAKPQGNEGPLDWPLARMHRVEDALAALARTEKKP